MTVEIDALEYWGSIAGKRNKSTKNLSEILLRRLQDYRQYILVKKIKNNRGKGNTCIYYRVNALISEGAAIVGSIISEIERGEKGKLSFLWIGLFIIVGLWGIA